MANPRIMQAAKKFHQECANAGVHLTKEVGDRTSLKDARINIGLPSECIRVVERQTERLIEIYIVD